MKTFSIALALIFSLPSMASIYSLERGNSDSGAKSINKLVRVKKDGNYLNFSYCILNKDSLEIFDHPSQISEQDYQNEYSCKKLGQHNYYNSYTVTWAIYHASDVHLLGSFMMLLFSEERGVLLNLFSMEGDTPNADGFTIKAILDENANLDVDEYRIKIKNVLNMIDRGYPGMKSKSEAFRD